MIFEWTEGKANNADYFMKRILKNNCNGGVYMEIWNWY